MLFKIHQNALYAAFETFKVRIVLTPEFLNAFVWYILILGSLELFRKQGIPRSSFGLQLKTIGWGDSMI